MSQSSASTDALRQEPPEAQPHNQPAQKNNPLRSTDTRQTMMKNSISSFLFYHSLTDSVDTQVKLPNLNLGSYRRLLLLHPLTSPTYSRQQQVQQRNCTMHDACIWPPALCCEASGSRHLGVNIPLHRQLPYLQGPQGLVLAPLRAPPFEWLFVI
jgi:hypothetical protein